MTAGLVAAEACCRFLHVAAAIAVWGGAGYLAVLVPSGLAEEIGRKLAPLGVIAIVVAVLTTLARLPLEAAVVGGSWGGALDPAILGPLLTQTNIGTGWLVELGAALVLAATLLLPGRMRRDAVAVAAGLLLACAALTGHAVMRTGATGALLMMSYGVHVLAGGAWLGALIPLVAVLQRFGRVADAAPLTALTRFSTAGHFAVALTVLTGIVNTRLIVGGPPLALAVPYQAMLMAKIALVLLMIGLAGYNRYVYTPRVAGDRAGAARAIRRGAVAEIIIGAMVIGLVSVFGLLNPA
jgi:putative copper resistance protein D